MNRYIKIGLIFTVIFFVTKASSSADLSASAAKAMPDADSFKAKCEDGTEYLEAYRKGSRIGYCIKVKAEGYVGPIYMLAGVDTTGVMTNLVILEHQETEGTGSKIAEDGFLNQFKGKGWRDISERHSVDAISGATISSNAVIEAAGKSVKEFLLRHKAKLDKE